MTINPCLVCGAKIRLAVMKITIMRRRGVSQWLARMDGERCVCLEPFHCSKMKSDKTKPTPYEKMLAKWNAQNPGDELCPTK